MGSNQRCGWHAIWRFVLWIAAQEFRCGSGSICREYSCHTHDTADHMLTSRLAAKLSEASTPLYILTFSMVSENTAGVYGSFVAFLT